jgi:hypothetical protein
LATRYTHTHKHTLSHPVQHILDDEINGSAAQVSVYIHKHTRSLTGHTILGDEIYGSAVQVRAGRVPEITRQTFSKVNFLVHLLQKKSR